MTLSGQPIETAPRDGTTVIVGDPDVGQFLMRWDAGAVNGLFLGRKGFWVSPCGGLTWSEHDGFGPTYWLPLQ